MLLIFCAEFTSRTHYVFDWVFGRWGIKYTNTCDVEQFANSPLPRVWYDRSRPKEPHSLWVGASGLLEDEILKEWRADVAYKDGLPYFFSNDSEFGFDIFSFVFFMISRYEEYLPSPMDEHGRFCARSSLAFKHHFLHLPIVDIWLEKLRDRLAQKFPKLSFSASAFAPVITYDIDIAYKFRGRNRGRAALAFGNDVFSFRWSNAWQRALVLAGLKSDPWDVYGYLKEKLAEQQASGIFFFPVGKRSEHDRNLSLGNKTVRNLIRFVSGFGEVGLHPSYRSLGDEQEIATEKKALEKLDGSALASTRQHYLRFKIPDTFLALNRLGFRRDYSMGFHDAPGFRAGTCSPFFFYDLKNERQTSLQMLPTCWMDATFLHYDRAADEALPAALALIGEIKKVNGWFIPVFHNNYLATPGERSRHEAILHEVFKITGP